MSSRPKKNEAIAAAINDTALVGMEEMRITTIREAFDRWKAALVDEGTEESQAARRRAHARSRTWKL
jgi:hypothetical protein